MHLTFSIQLKKFIIQVRIPSRQAKVKSNRCKQLSYLHANINKGTPVSKTTEEMSHKVASGKALPKSQENQLTILRDTRRLYNNVTDYWFPCIMCTTYRSEEARQAKKKRHVPCLSKSVALLC